MLSQRRQVILFHCSNKKGRTNISYNNNISQQHCDQEKIINMGSGWMCFILEHFKLPNLNPNIFIFRDQSTLFSSKGFTDLDCVSFQPLFWMQSSTFLFKAQIFFFSSLIFNSEYIGWIQVCRQKKPFKQMDENLRGLFAWASCWSEQCASSHVNKLIKV